MNHQTPEEHIQIRITRDPGGGFQAAPASVYARRQFTKKHGVPAEAVCTRASQSEFLNDLAPGRATTELLNGQSVQRRVRLSTFLNWCQKTGE